MVSQDSDFEEQQPLLPRFGMLWFFIAAVVVAIALFIIRAADQGQSFAAAMVFTVLFLAVASLMSGLCFAAAFLLGSLERSVSGEDYKVSSPFSSGSMPEQLVPPKKTDED
ncbi:MAG: hypothetical protein AB8B50_10165 [Pirellulaceae bacterium]